MESRWQECNSMSHEDNQSISYCRQVSGKFIDFSLRTMLMALIWTLVPILAARSFEPEPLRRSVRPSQGVVDDWFESLSDVFGPRQVTSWTPDNITPPPPTGTNSF
jgi:hypothetical protein